MVSDFHDQLTKKYEYLAGQKEKHGELPFPVGILARQQMDLCSTLLRWIDKFQEEYDECTSIV